MRGGSRQYEYRSNDEQIALTRVKAAQRAAELKLEECLVAQAAASRAARATL